MRRFDARMVQIVQVMIAGVNRNRRHRAEMFEEAKELLEESCATS